MPKRRTLILLSVAALLSACCFFEWVIEPWRKPLYRAPSGIREYLLEQAPLGTGKHEIEALVQARGLHHGGVVRNPRNSIDVRFGSYSNYGMLNEVYVSYVFDGQDRLMDIEVTKFWADAP